MSDIAPIQSPYAASIDLAARAADKPASVSSAPDRGSDSVELSNAAQILSKLKGPEGVRADLIAQVKAEIAAGTYETPEKLDIAIAGLAEDLA
jgi:negative regulator of flagellin synthesis FlgM